MTTPIWEAERRRVDDIINEIEVNLNIYELNEGHCAYCGGTMQGHIGCRDELCQILRHDAQQIRPVQTGRDLLFSTFNREGFSFVNNRGRITVGSLEATFDINQLSQVSEWRFTH